MNIFGDTKKGEFFWFVVSVIGIELLLKHFHVHRFSTEEFGWLLVWFGLFMGAWRKQ